jgi:hypothetical protein
MKKAPAKPKAAPTGSLPMVDPSDMSRPVPPPPAPTDSLNNFGGGKPSSK